MEVMRLVEILDHLEPAMLLSNGREIKTAEDLATQTAHDQYDYAAEKRQGHLVIYKVREDGVRRRAYQQVN
jgi:hypothetical protein